MFSKMPTAMTADTVQELVQSHYPMLIYEKNYPIVTAFGPYETLDLTHMNTNPTAGSDTAHDLLPVLRMDR